MEKTRFGRMTSLLLVFVFLLAPLRLTRADQGVSVKIQKQSGGGTSYDVVVSNTGDRELTGWTITITVPEGATYSGSWNCQESISGNVVKLTSQYDWQIPKPGESVNPTGFNMTGDFEISDIGVIISPKFAGAPTQTPTPDPKKDTPTPTPTNTPTPPPTATPTTAPTSAPTSALAPPPPGVGALLASTSTNFSQLSFV